MTEPTATLTYAAPQLRATSARGHHDHDEWGRPTAWHPNHGVVDILFCWNDADPLAVLAAISLRGGGGKDWWLDRDTLARGLDQHVGGHGADWGMFPDLARRDGLAVELVLALHGHGVGYNLSIPLLVTPLRRFLDRTYTVVPAGADLDMDPAELAGGAAA